MSQYNPNMTIAILLSTYNGERYLIEQLDSLFSQTYSEFKLYVHDDGSSDKTISIIKEYQKRYIDQIVIKHDNCRRGAGNSFMWLLDNVSADYYMFCDQDDVWMPNKIEVSLNQIRQIEDEQGNHVPVGVFTDLTLVDEKLNIIHPSFWKFQNIKPRLTSQFKYLVYGNGVTGCTLMINQAVKTIIQPLPDSIGLHDYWLALLISRHGYLYYYPNPTIYYRQHRNNVAGAGIMNTGMRFSIKPFIRWYYNSKLWLKQFNHDNLIILIINKFIYTIKRYYS